MRVIGALQEQEADFAPFIEDDGQFAKHCKCMRQVGPHSACNQTLSAMLALSSAASHWKEVQNAGICSLHRPEEILKPTNGSAGGLSCSSTHCLLQDGTWAGQHELVAVARMLPAELRIYQAGQPSWTISSGVTSGKAGGPTLAWPLASSKYMRGLVHATSSRLCVTSARLQLLQVMLTMR